MPEYTDHVLRMTEARHKALSARITYDALKKEVDLVRTYEASRRYDNLRAHAPPGASRLRVEAVPRRRDAGRRRSCCERAGGEAAGAGGGSDCCLARVTARQRSKSRPHARSGRPSARRCFSGRKRAAESRRQGAAVVRA